MWGAVLRDAFFGTTWFMKCNRLIISALVTIARMARKARYGEMKKV